MSSYELQHEVKGEALLVRASGKFDRQAGAAVEELITQHDGVRVLNLEDVEYISSSGVAFLAKLSTRQHLRLASLAQCVLDTLSLAGINKILAIYDDEAAAQNAQH